MDNNVNGNNGMNNNTNIPNETVDLGNSIPNQNNTMNSGVSNTNVNSNMNYGSVNNVGNPTVGNFNNNMTNTSNSYNDDFMIKKDRKIWPFLLVIIILFIIGLLCGYYFVLMSPKNILIKTIDSVYTNIDNVYKSIKDQTEKNNSKGAYEGNITFTSKEFNANVNADYYLGYDVSNEGKPINYFETSFKYNDKGPVKVTMYYENNIVYLLSNDLYKKVIGYDLSSSCENGNCITSDIKLDYNVDDIKYLSDLIKDTFKNNINYDKVSKSIKNKSGLYFETIYNLDKEEQINIINKIITTIKNDDKAIEIITKMSDITKEDIKDMTEITSSEYENEDIKVVLHNSVVDGKLSYLEISNSTDIMYLTINDEETNIEFKEVGSDSDSLSIKFDNNSFSGTFNVKDYKDENGNNVSGYKIVFSIKNNNGNVTSSFTAYSSSDNENPTFNVTLTANDKSSEGMKSFDKSNAVMFDKLTENDITEIYINVFGLLNKLGIEIPMDGE